MKINTFSGRILVVDGKTFNFKSSDEKVEARLVSEVLDLRNETIKCNGSNASFGGQYNSIGLSINDSMVVAVGGYLPGLGYDTFTSCE